MLSEEAKRALKLTKESLGWWEKRTSEIERESESKEFIEKWKISDPGISEERIREINEYTIRINKKIIRFLRGWREKNGELYYEIVYHPSIEKEIGSEYGKKNLNFEIIILVLITIFLFIWLKGR